VQIVWFVFYAGIFAALGAVLVLSGFLIVGNDLSRQAS